MNELTERKDFFLFWIRNVLFLKQFMESTRASQKFMIRASFGPVDLGSIPGHVIPKSLKMALDTSLLNTQQYKVRIKGKVEQSRESALPYTSV